MDKLTKKEVLLSAYFFEAVTVYIIYVIMNVREFIRKRKQKKKNKQNH